MSLNKTTTAEKLEKVEKKDSLQERWNLNSIWLGPQISIDGKANDEVNETGVTEAYRINKTIRLKEFIVLILLEN